MQGEEGNAEEETRFSLPMLPSPAVALMLLGAVQEVQRAGGSALDSASLHMLQWHLAQACTAALRCFLWRVGMGGPEACHGP